MTDYRKAIDTPVGRLTLVASEKALVAVLWPDDAPGRVRLGPVAEDKNLPVLIETERQLSDYFAGARIAFDLPLDFRGTDFQKQVWRALLTIPFGETRSYAGIARQIGRPSASRAVGAANGKNPISIIATCHRVVGTAGDMRGFAGGLDVKERLLAFEGAARRNSATGSRAAKYTQPNG